MGVRPLAGIRVVEVTHHVTGPVTTQVFADAGAEVIQIETASRRMVAASLRGPGAPPPPPKPRPSTYKLSVSINFQMPKGLELARKLIASADVFVENLAGGTLARRGLGYEDVKNIKPDIIYLSTCMMGQTGPHYSHAASGHKLSALAGFNHITGWPDRGPGWVGTYTDFVAPRYNIIAILAALDYRKRTGKGQLLDMSQYEPGLQFMAPALLDFAVNGRVAGREGNRHPSSAPHNAYRCAGEERWCAIAVFTDEEWRSLCKAIGNSSLADDPRFAALTARKQNEDSLDDILNGWTQSRTAEDVAELLQSAGVPSGLVENAEDQIVKDPHLQYRHFFWEMASPEEAAEAVDSQPFYRLSLRVRQGPALGEHNSYVMKDLLGLTEAEISELTAEQVIS